MRAPFSQKKIVTPLRCVLLEPRIRIMKLNFLLLLSVLLSIGNGLQATSVDYDRGLQTARAQRVEQLTKPDGWLTLIGLHYLQPGRNTVGTASDNSLALAAGPAHLGTVELSSEGRITFTAATGVEVRIDGQLSAAAELSLGNSDRKPTLVSVDTVSFFVIERGGRKALRVRDSAAERRTHFLGLDYFATDPSWRIEARWVPFATPRNVPITNIAGHTTMHQIPGKAVFQRDGATYELLPLVEGPDDPLFFIFADATSGDQTYQMRFLDAEPPKDGVLVLDFNLAENPPCAFTPFATCPLPPKKNRLTLAIIAGEKNYRGAHP